MKSVSIKDAPACLNLNDKAMWVNGYNDAVEKLKAQPVQEPIYQYQMGDGSWVDQTQASYEYNKRHAPNATVRIVYAAPVQPVQPVKQAPLKSFKELEYKVGWQRYEKVRKLNVQQFSELFQRGLQGERFDEMVDGLEAKP